MSSLAPPVGPGHSGIYVHFPYCSSKCPYCDFNSHVLDHDDERYADAVISELRHRRSDLGSDRLSSVFFGGGTPSRWDPRAVGRVIQAIFDAYGAEDLEITLEANPGSVDADRFVAYRDVGVNRLSIGCQSFDDSELQWLGRTHDGTTGARAVETAVAADLRVSLDLMYGLPDQTWTAVAANLHRAIDFGVDHISAYGLTVEPDTVLARRASLRLFEPLDDDRMADMYEGVTACLADAGYDRYEVSNYAKRGRECLHNVLYWHGGAYLGLGAGAHGYRPGRGGEPSIRRENPKAPRAYIESIDGGSFAPRTVERLDSWDRIRDRLLVAFRTRWGTSLESLEIEEELRPRLEPALRRTADQEVSAGRLEARDGRWQPTADGFRLADTVARAFVEAVDQARAGRPS